MKKTGYLFILLAVSLAAASAARAVEPVTMDQNGVDQMLTGRAGQTLQAMADQTCPPGTCFDGRPILGRDGASVIVDRKLTEYDPGHVSYRGGGRGGPAEIWVKPTWTYDETMGIPDRGAYVAQKEKSGAIWGGIFGAILGTILGFVLNPAVGVMALAAGIAGGYFVGKHEGETQPAEYHRSETYWSPQGQQPGA